MGKSRKFFGSSPRVNTSINVWSCDIFYQVALSLAITTCLIQTEPFRTPPGSPPVRHLIEMFLKFKLQLRVFLQFIIFSWVVLIPESLFHVGKTIVLITHDSLFPVSVSGWVLRLNQCSDFISKSCPAVLLPGFNHFLWKVMHLVPATLLPT